MCSCAQCVHGGGNSVSDTDRLHQSIMAGHSRFQSSPWPLRTRQQLKGLCLLMVALSFCIGVAIGLLVSLYLLPLNNSESGFNQRTFPEFKVQRPNSQHLIQREFLLTTSPSPTPGLATTQESIPESISSRFPEFAHLEALMKDQIGGYGDPVGSKDFPNPILRRPNPNVQFIPPASRILSLHPIQQEIPEPKFPSSADAGSLDSQISESEVRTELDQSLRRNHVELLDSIYWSPQVESQLPQGFSEAQLESWRDFVHNSTILKMEEGCGRMQNRLLTLSNETRACCRYRQNSDQIQGEIFSFYLSQILGIRNVAPSALNLVQVSGKQWAPVRQELSIAQWADEKPVVFTQFLENLSPANIPIPFRDSKRSLHPADILNSVNSMDVNSVSELAQWSDLIVFDYLTANLDRIVNNLFNFQWNPSMMDAPAHNLVKDPSTGLLVFLDNESGLLHGYRLLDKYEQYHRLMLDSLCIFRRSTAAAIKRLFREKNVGLRLKRMFQRSEPQLVDYLPMLPDRSIKILNLRIEVVHNQIVKCESLYVP